MGLISSIFKARDKPQNRTAGSGYSFFFGGTTSGKAVTERSAMQMTAVYACVRILSEAIAGLPLHLYRYKDGGGKEKAVDHPLYLLLHDEPNPEMSSFVFRETLMTHLLLWGNAYAQIIRNGKGEVIALYPLMPNKMTVDRDADGHLYYKYMKTTDEAPTMPNSTVILPPNDVLHIPGLGFDGLVGYSPIAMAKNSIGMAIACEEYGARFFSNGAAPGGVLEHPGTVKEPQKIRDSWNKSFMGAQNSHRIAVLEEGMKYTPIGISPNEAQFLETRKFQLNEIARIFRVPPHMVGDLEKSSFSNIEQQSLEFVKYTLDPWVSRWEQSMVRSLLLPDEKKEYYIKFNVDGLLRGDYQSRMNGYATARQNGWMSANDIRELENLDRIPAEDGGDLYLVNGNMLPLENIIQQQVRILDMDGENITEAYGIIDWYVDKANKVYYLLRHHKLDLSGTLNISYSVMSDNGRKTTLDKWADLDGKEYAFINANHIGFGRYKSPIDSRGKSPVYGVPLNFGCGEVEERIFNDYKLIEDEFKNGKSVIFTDPRNLMKDEERKQYRIADNIIPIQSRAGQTGSNIDIFNPELRFTPHYSKLVEDMAMYERQVGTSKGILTDNETAYTATATAVKRANSDTMALIDKIHNAIDAGNEMTLKADGVFLNISPDLWQYKADYYDPFEDPAEQWNRLKEASQMGAAESADLVKWIFPNMTDDDIQQKLDRINAEKQSNTNNSLENMLNM